MNRGATSLYRPGIVASLLVALVFVGGCSGGGKSTQAQAQFDSELVAIAKKAKNRKEFKQAIEDKIKEKDGFVPTRKSKGKAKTKVR